MQLFAMWEAPKSKDVTFPVSQQTLAPKLKIHHQLL